MTQVSLLRLPHGADLALPSRATAGAAGFDLRAAVAVPLILLPGARALVPTGIALAMPDGWEGQVRPRSGLAVKYGVTVLNSPGTIDCDYRGEIFVPLINHGGEPFMIQRGERIAQIIFAIVAPVELREAATLDETERGEAGFGSTGQR